MSVGGLASPVLSAKERRVLHNAGVHILAAAMHPAVPGGGGVRAAAVSAETLTALAAALQQTPQFRGVSTAKSFSVTLDLAKVNNDKVKEGRPLRDLTQLLVMVADWS
eukprot:2162485-Pyramimonas_sp.AAC.1